MMRFAVSFARLVLAVHHRLGEQTNLRRDSTGSATRRALLREPSDPRACDGFGCHIAAYLAVYRACMLRGGCFGIFLRPDEASGPAHGSPCARSAPELLFDSHDFDRRVRIGDASLRV